MQLISHRGNLEGRRPEVENTIEYVLRAIHAGFLCEIDLHCVSGKLFLGHDAPQYSITSAFLHRHRHSLIIHCKNTDALRFMSTRVPSREYHYFFHDKDQYTHTNQGIIWCNIGVPAIEGAIAVLGEEQTELPIDTLLGVCTDYPALLKAKQT